MTVERTEGGGKTGVPAAIASLKHCWIQAKHISSCLGFLRSQDQSHRWGNYWYLVEISSVEISTPSLNDVDRTKNLTCKVCTVLNPYSYCIFRAVGRIYLTGSRRIDVVPNTTSLTGASKTPSSTYIEVSVCSFPQVT